MDNRSHTCSCMNCVSQNCFTCRHQEASVCKCEDSVSSQEKLTQIYNNSSQAKSDKPESTNDDKINNQCKEPLENEKPENNKYITECNKTCSHIVRPVKKEGRKTCPNIPRPEKPECYKTCQHIARPVKKECQKTCPNSPKSDNSEYPKTCPNSPKSEKSECQKTCPNSPKPEKSDCQNSCPSSPKPEKSVCQKTCPDSPQPEKMECRIAQTEKTECNKTCSTIPQPQKTECNKTCPRPEKTESHKTCTPEARLERTEIIQTCPNMPQPEPECHKTCPNIPKPECHKTCPNIPKKECRKDCPKKKGDADEKKPEYICAQDTKKREKFFPDYKDPESGPRVMMCRPPTKDEPVPDKGKKIEIEKTKDAEAPRENTDLTSKPSHKEDKIERCKKCNKILNECAKKRATEKVAEVDGRKKRCDKPCCHASHHKSNKTLEISKDPDVPRTKICPAFCPTCHKIFIEEQKEEPANKTVIILNECPNCLKAPMPQEKPESKTPPPMKCSDLKEKCCQSKINKISENSKANQICCPPPSTTTGEQTEDKKQGAQQKGFLAWLLALLGLCKEIDKIQSETTNNDDKKNADTDTKSKDVSLKCPNCKDIKKYSQSIEDIICSKICESLKEMNDYCPIPCIKQKPLEKCREECGVCVCTQTEDTKQDPFSADKLSSEQKDNIKTWIKECVHKELEDVRNCQTDIVENTDKTTKPEDTEILVEKCEPSKHCENTSCAFYDKIKDFIKDKFTGPDKAEVNAVETQTSNEKQVIDQDRKINIHACKIKIKAPQFACDKIRGQRKIVLGFEKEKEGEASVSDSQTPTCRAYKTSAGELSAEVMNVPYTKYKQSIETTDTTPNKINRINKTCSCKDSKSHAKTEGEVYNSSERNTKDLDKCECALCKCIECKEQTMRSSCDCKPCECIKCDNLKEKHKQTNFIVASVTPVRQRQQRPCQYFPRGCLERDFGTLVKTHYTQETDRDERRRLNCSCDHCENDHCKDQGINTCSCDRQLKFMKKPIIRNKNEYDVYYSINDKHDFKKYEYLYKKKRSPVTIYTSLTHCRYFPRTKTFIDSAYSHLSSRTMSVSIIPENYWALRANAHLISNSTNECDCKPCECPKCKKHFLEGHIPYRRDNCSCEICDCINCATLSILYEMEKNQNKGADLFETKQKCNCLPCNCKHCSKYTNMIIQDECDNLKGDTIFSPTDRKLNNGNLLATDSEYYINHLLSNKESKYHTTLKNKSIYSKQSTNINNRNKLTGNEYHVYCNRELCTKYSNSSEKQNSKASHQIQSDESQETDNTLTNSQMSNHTEDIDSTISSSMTSLSCAQTNDTSSKKPKKHKPYRRSSCNSSGYDYSDYLIRFPTSTVETCIKDVMSLLYNKPDKDNFKPSKTLKPVKDFSESSMSTIHYQKELSTSGLQSLETLQLNDTDKVCKSGNSDKSCNCNPCDCDKCSYKMPKLKRCRCDCTSCRCDGTCLSEDRSVLIRKNETTQTAIPAPDCGEVITKELSSLKLKKSIVTFSENNRVVKWTDFPTRVPFTYNTRTHTINNNAIDNHDSVQRTIHEAKQFSIELLGILQKYEKANRDFDIMSERYKSLHKSMLCEDVYQKQFSEQPNNYQVAYIKTMPIFKNNISSEKSRMKFEEDNFESSKLDKTENKEDLLYTNTSETDEQNIFLEKYIKTDEGKIYEENYNVNCSLNKNAIKPRFESSNQEVKKTKSAPNDDDHTQTKQIKTNNSKTIANSVGKSYLEKLKREYKKYSQHIDEVINQRRQTVWKKETNNSIIENQVKENTTNKCLTTTKFNGFSYQIPPVKEFINKENSGDLNTVFICQSQKYHEPHRNNEILPKILNIEQLDSLKKIIVPEKKGTTIHARRPHGSSTSTSRIASRRFELCPSGIKSAIIETNAIEKCNSNSLKVAFQMIRKVSDHSILLKWKTPDDTTNIEGYEIKVGGRSIQRILNPTRNMAVITCLPHSDKVKITVRTITKMADGHTPCVTISYCNRC